MKLLPHKTKKKVPFFFLRVISLLFLCVLVSRNVYAADATLFVSPIVGTYISGDIFTLSVQVSSAGQSINAIEGKLQYDPKELEVIGVDSATSIISSWTDPPAFTNERGEISFAGLLATSTVVDRGEVLKFSLRAVRTGAVHVYIGTGAAIHAADGTGGNILTALSGGTYNIVPKDNGLGQDELEGADSGTTATGGEVLGAATGTIITSTTHPDQDAWYNSTTSTIMWDMPPTATRALLSLNKNTDGDGVIPYDTSVHEKTIKNIGEGISYVHLTREFSDGHIDTTHYRLQIDLSPPRAFTISEKPRNDTADPNIVILIEATDTLSGIDHYDVVIDQKSSVTWIDDGSHEYHVPALAVGAHDVLLSVFDKAGNSASSRLQFSVEYLPTPVLGIVDEKSSEGGQLKLSIQAPPSSSQHVSIAHGDETPIVEESTVDATSHTTFTSTLRLLPGAYHIIATAYDKEGRVSRASEQLTITVAPSFLGVIKRHPLIPIALFALITFAIIWWIFLRRMQSTQVDHNLYDTPEHRDIPKAVAPRREQGIQGAVVLEKKQSARFSATRL